MSSAAEARAGGELAGRRAVVMGLGSFGGGVGAARWLAACGARVLVTDLRSAEELAPSLAALGDLSCEVALGGHRPEDFEAADLVVANPAVRPDHPLLARARARGARVTSEIELFLGAVRARVVAITGTQGKSSTTHLAHGLLEAAGFRAHVGGNLGGSLLERLDAIGPDDVCVLELSSYQLAGLADPSRLTDRVVAVGVTNVLADHLDRHGGEQGYLDAKLRILELPRAGGAALVPAGDGRLHRARPGLRLVRVHPPEAPRAPIQQDPPGGAAELFATETELRRGDEVLGRREDVRLPGSFQQANALLALGLARELGAAPADLARALPRIGGLPHRFEPLGLVAGRAVIDNGVSTTPDSTIAALRSLAEPCTLLVGGRSKGLPLDELAEEARRCARRAIAFGEAGPELAAALRARGIETLLASGLAEAVPLAFAGGGTGAVLFSPACSSFDAFPNFAARARAFRDLLRALDPAWASGGAA